MDTVVEKVGSFLTGSADRALCAGKGIVRPRTGHKGPDGE